MNGFQNQDTGLVMGDFAFHHLFKRFIEPYFYHFNLLAAFGLRFRKR